MADRDREALAWAAGFFDGEGHAGTILVPHPRFTMGVTQYELTTLDRFQAAVGGLGRVHTSRRLAPSGRTRSSWSAQNFQHAQAVVTMLWPWLSEPKRHQIATALRLFHEKYQRPGRPGEANSAAKLTAVQVAEIRSRYVPRRVTLHALAAEYGVSHATIHLIVNRARWTDEVSTAVGRTAGG